jgi:SAM-dependent methyltransferase
VTSKPKAAGRGPDPAASRWSDFYRNNGFDLARLVRVSSLYQPYLRAIDLHAPGPRGLEIGTGTGWAAVYLSHEGYEIVAIDRDPQIVTEAIRLNGKFGGTARFLTMDLFHLGFDSGCFDFAFHQGVMEHFPEAEIRSALQEQLRVADRVIFSVPGARYKTRDFGDERLWTKEKWLTILAPFQVIHTFGFGYTNDAARLCGLMTHHPRYCGKSWAAALERLNDRRFAGELGFVIQKKPG